MSSLGYGLQGFTHGLGQGVALVGAVRGLEHQKEAAQQGRESHELNKQLTELKLEALKDEKTRAKAKEKYQMLTGLHQQIEAMKQQGQQVPPEWEQARVVGALDLWDTSFRSLLDQDGVERHLIDVAPNDRGMFEIKAVDTKGQMQTLNANQRWDDSAPALELSQEDVLGINPMIGQMLTGLDTVYGNTDRREKREDMLFKYGLDKGLAEHKEKVKAKHGTGTTSAKLQELALLQEAPYNLSPDQALQKVYDAKANPGAEVRRWAEFFAEADTTHQGPRQTADVYLKMGEEQVKKLSEVPTEDSRPGGAGESIRYGQPPGPTASAITQQAVGGGGETVSDILAGKPAPQGGRSMSMAEVQQRADKHSVSVEEVIARAQKAGYTVTR